MNEYEVCESLNRSSCTLLNMHKGCYVFTPEGTDSVSQRPRKRRKIEPAEASANPNTDLLFTPLLKGLEKIENTRIRSDLFERSWRPMETLLKVHRSSQ